MANATEEYLLTSVMTAPPERLHLLVVEAALRYARIGREALEARRRDRSFAALSKSRECVAEMLSSLRSDLNPELADRLKSLFLFCHGQLLRADLEQEPQHASDAIRILEIHRDTWLELISRLAKDGAREATQGPVLSDGSRSLDEAPRTLPAFAATGGSPFPPAVGIDFTT